MTPIHTFRSTLQSGGRQPRTLPIVCALVICVMGIGAVAPSNEAVAAAAKKPTTTRRSSAKSPAKPRTTARTTTRRAASSSSSPSSSIGSSTSVSVAGPTGAPATIAIGASGVTTLPGPSTPGSISWTACGDFDCATLAVPRDYNNPSGPTIGIGLQRRRATGPSPKGSVLINPGGPSGSGIEFLVSRPKLFTDEMRAQYHVVGFDPRGVGRSAPLSCASTRERTARTGRQYVEAVRDACFNRQPELMAAITTANTARDMERIRIALGEEKLNYLGVSYGTYLGLVYADLYPERVGRFMIDSAVDPSLRAIEITAGQYAVYEARVMSFLTRCSASKACAFGPNSVARYEALLTRLETSPLSDGVFTLDRARLESATFALVRAVRETTLANLLVEFERTNTVAVSELARIFDSGIPDVNDLLNDPDGDGMYYQVACNEGFHNSASTDPASQKVSILTARAPHFRASATAAANSAACAVWGQQTDTRPVPVPKPGVPAMLFFGSISDNVTPAVWTRKVASQWPGSVYIEVAGAAHGVTTNNTCANQVASVFMLTAALPAANVCG